MFPGVWARCSRGITGKQGQPSPLCGGLRLCLTLITVLGCGPGPLRVRAPWGPWTQALRTGLPRPAPQPCAAALRRDPALQWPCVCRPHLCAVRWAAPPPCRCAALPVWAVLLSQMPLLHWAVDSPRVWAELLAMHHCAVPTDGMPPQHCVFASHGFSALNCTGREPAPGPALPCALLPAPGTRAVSV